jgi:hypothetical protein
MDPFNSEDLLDPEDPSSLIFNRETGINSARQPRAEWTWESDGRTNGIPMDSPTITNPNLLSLSLEHGA